MNSIFRSDTRQAEEEACCSEAGAVTADVTATEQLEFRSETVPRTSAASIADRFVRRSGPAKERQLRKPDHNGSQTMFATFSESQKRKDEKLLISDAVRQVAELRRPKATKAVRFALSKYEFTPDFGEWNSLADGHNGRRTLFAKQT